MHRRARQLWIAYAGQCGASFQRLSDKFSYVAQVLMKSSAFHSRALVDTWDGVSEISLWELPRYESITSVGKTCQSLLTPLASDNE